MKKLLLLFVLITISFVNLQAQCKAKTVVSGCKPNLKPFIYDTYALNDLVVDDQPKTVNITFTAFAGEKYKIVFCSNSLGENMVGVNIYDKSPKVKTRKQVFSNENGIDNLFWSFEPTKAGTYYIEYTVPANKVPGTVTKGCIVMMIGYQETGGGGDDW